MSSKALKAAEYSKAVDDAQLVNIRLVSGSFKVSPSFRSSSPDVERFFEQKTSAPKYNAENRALIGMVSCRCWMRPKASSEATTPSDPNGEEPEDLLSIDAEYVLAFRIEGEHDAQMLNTFFKKLAPLSAWPYFRTHVATVASEGGLDIPPLPIKKLMFRVKSAENYADPE